MNITSKFFWWCFQLDIPFILEESISWKLRSLGINSFCLEFPPDSLEIYKLSIWLPSNEWSLEQRKGLIFHLMPLAETFGIILESPHWEKCDNKDWSSAWKKYWEPDPVGNSILILPAWLDLPNDFVNRKVVRIDPGYAFGTGNHPTTRLCLEALERNSLSGKVIADLGCGSGILGLAALSLGAKKVYAVDTDSLAVDSTRNNFLLNDLNKDSFFVSQGSISQLQYKLNKGQVDLLICNILLPVIKKLVVGFDSIVQSGGNALLSGILLDQISELSSFLKTMGWQVNNSWEKSNWALLEIGKAS